MGIKEIAIVCVILSIGYWLGMNGMLSKFTSS